MDERDTTAHEDATCDGNGPTVDGDTEPVVLPDLDSTHIEVSTGTPFDVDEVLDRSG